jgi:hypothetical protein
MESIANIVSLGPKANSRELSLESRPLVDNFISLGDTHISPVRHFDHLLDMRELHLGVVVDPEDMVFDVSVRLETVFIELNLG